MSNDLAIWAITPNGINLGKTLNLDFPGAAFFVPEKEFQNQDLALPDKTDLKLFSGLKQELNLRFKEFNAHIFIFSTGIAVRLIAPLLESKIKDPAVVVMDEKGFHAIILVSGHLGGANELAVKAALAVNATPVITTATDINNLPSMDMVAKKAGLVIENPGAIKTVNMKLLKGEPLAMEDPKRLVIPSLPSASVAQADDRAPDIICTWETMNVPRETLKLRPKILIVGIGCNRNTPMADMMKFLIETFEKQNLSMYSIAALATTSVKADEIGILELAEKLSCPVHFYDRDQLNSVDTIQNPSKMAEKYLGVKSVCEAAAILGTSRGHLIVPKQKTYDVTLAVAVPK